MEPYSRLLVHWKLHGYVAPPGVSCTALLAFEAAHKIQFPNQIRRYLLYMNGGGFGDDNSYRVDAFTFWPIERIKTVESICSDGSLQPSDWEKYREHLIFADYLLECYWYAISTAGEVTLIPGPEKPRPVARSFGEFIDLYISNDRCLHYGPG